ncbi:hypothetical protein psal_cds_848 [Pandoravirus salinus]|uniref:Ankyrin repeat domain containing protein n=1 Tax=Pandoravirus salinus TaxID=1349410 RepID=A0A291ATX9_9VIRU|nr:hypothetical protein psal_cds_848 [Pandoravirus salinus]ATE82238.1 hypothetical protein psal_cds_848 [Pandoravirus salinus]
MRVVRPRARFLFFARRPASDKTNSFSFPATAREKRQEKRGKMNARDDVDDQGDGERHPTRLDDMPIEVVHMIARHLDTPRDLGAFAIAAPHLVADPVAPRVARMVGFARASDILVAGAPLAAVVALFAEWDEPVAVHMLGDAAEGGHVNVVQWVYERIADGLRDTKARRAATTARRHYDESSDSCSSSSESEDDNSNGANDDNANKQDDCASDSSSSSSWCAGYWARERLRRAPNRFRDHCGSARTDDLLWLDALTRAARKRHLDVLAWIVKGPCYGDTYTRSMRSIYHSVMIEAAARGHLDVLVMLHTTVAVCTRRGSCGCPPEIGIAAVQADRPDIVDWLCSVVCSGVPPFTARAVATAITKAHRPRFIAWAAMHGHAPDPTCLDDLAQRNVVRTLALVHETGLCACTPQAVRAAARAGSLSVLQWAAGDDPSAPRAGAAWRPTDVAMLAATNRRVEVIAWLRTRQDGQRALTVGVARAALAAGCIDAAAHIRPFGTWDALEAAVASGNVETVRAVADTGGVGSPAAFVGAIRHGGSDVLAFLCERYGVAFVEGALASLAGVACAASCLDWLGAYPPTAHLCLAEAYAANLGHGEVDTPGSCHCPVCAAP